MNRAPCAVVFKTIASKMPDRAIQGKDHANSRFGASHCDAGLTFSAFGDRAVTSRPASSRVTVNIFD